MSIVIIPFIPSPGLRKEIDFYSTTDQGQRIYSEVKETENLISLIETNPPKSPLIIRKSRNKE